MKFNPIHLAYGVMIVGCILCFVLSKNVKRDLRSTCDAFALTFVKLANHIAPKKIVKGLKVEKLPDGSVKALPFDKQPESLQGAIERANDEESVKLFKELAACYDEVEKAAGRNKTNRSQFSEPIKEILYVTHTFLTGCENLETIKTKEAVEEFNSFVLEQLKHRMTLLKRISGKTADEYREYNAVYQKEMEEAEIKEREEKRKKAGKKNIKPLKK